MLYRVRQFLGAGLAPSLTPTENQRVRAVLNNAAFALYQTMPPGDQRHSLKIHDTLVAQGYHARPLLEAALLHDVAKRELGLGIRTAVVLLNKLSPQALMRLADSTPHGWRYPFYVSLHHPELGAELAERARLGAQTCRLIRMHQTQYPHFDGAEKELLSEWHHALKVLDDLN